MTSFTKRSATSFTLRPQKPGGDPQQLQVESGADRFHIPRSDGSTPQCAALLRTNRLLFLPAPCWCSSGGGSAVTGRCGRPLSLHCPTDIAKRETTRDTT